jgi:phage terminase large subunit
MLQRVVPWPPNYIKHFAWRQEQLLKLREDPVLLAGAIEYYRDHPIEFIEHWIDTYDPRNAGTDQLTYLPFKLFKRQREAVQFIYACLKEGGSGLIEKSRDMGVTWLCCAISIHLWRFWDGAAIGWGSRKSDLVDRIGDMNSIFEKIRRAIERLPVEFYPAGFSLRDHMGSLKIINPNGGAITGESGDEIGRGGRSLIYFKDEAAKYERPELIEAALSDNAKVQIDFSSVYGLGTVFHRKRESGVDWSPGQPIVKDRVNVLIMDWRDHPGKTQEWYDGRKSKAIAEGLEHIFAQEIDRNYGASVVGTIVKTEWFRSSIDAHVHLNFGDDGLHCAALDIADEGTDTNALAIRKGIVLRTLEEWGERDTGVTARRALAACRPLGTALSPIELQYDFGGGWGAAFKAEHNRLNDEGLMPKTIRPVPWNAGGAVLYPDKHVVPKDKDSPLNEEFYANLKAQGWWELRRRFELTHRARTEPGFTYDTDDLISIDSRIPLLRKLEKEICQPTIGQSSKLKLLVNKQPDGAKSPNLADAVMMCYWPVPAKKIMRITDDILRRI